ncbi:MAG: DUF896 domain-containing protein [Ruminococcaceae bacterium]|nr:DUF896 domain-containing protein [Oscillospiraceae bacterium]
MTQNLILKINELAKKKREQGLTEQEQKLQKELYKEYLAQFRSNFKNQLNNVDVEYPDGKVVPLTDFKKK